MKRLGIMPIIAATVVLYLAGAPKSYAQYGFSDNTGDIGRTNVPIAAGQNHDNMSYNLITGTGTGNSQNGSNGGLPVQIDFGATATQGINPNLVKPTEVSILSGVFGGIYSSTGLPPTSLDSFVQNAMLNGTAFFIYGDEGSDGLPPLNNFEPINAGISGADAAGLTTGHGGGSNLPSASSAELIVPLPPFNNSAANPVNGAPTTAYSAYASAPNESTSNPNGPEVVVTNHSYLDPGPSVSNLPDF